MPCEVASRAVSNFNFAVSLPTPSRLKPVPLFMIVPTLRVGIPPLTLCVTAMDAIR